MPALKQTICLVFGYLQYCSYVNSSDVGAKSFIELASPIFHSYKNESTSQLKQGNVEVGAGYSSDTQEVTTNRCFAAKISSVNNVQVYVELSAGLSFNEFEKKFNTMVNVRGSIGMFSVDGLHEYSRSIKDTKHSFSLNYYYLASMFL